MELKDIKVGKKYKDERGNIVLAVYIAPVGDYEVAALALADDGKVLDTYYYKPCGLSEYKEPVVKYAYEFFRESDGFTTYGNFYDRQPPPYTASLSPGVTCKIAKFVKEG